MQGYRCGLLAGITCLLLGGALVIPAVSHAHPGQHNPGDTGKPHPPRKGGENPPPLKTTVKTEKKQHGTKDPVKMTLAVTNTTQKPITLNFSSGQKYDFEIKRGKGEAGVTVWKWSQGMMFTQMLSSRKLEPGKSLTFTETYKPGAKSAEGQTLPALTAGTYSVIATLTTTDIAPKPQSTTVFIVK